MVILYKTNYATSAFIRNWDLFIIIQGPRSRGAKGAIAPSSPIVFSSVVLFIFLTK